MKLILGCHGHRNFGWSLCKGTQNMLLNLNELGSEAEQVMDYLDRHCKLFESVVDDNNKVVNIVHYVINRGLVQDHMKKLIYESLAMHKLCGHYLFIRVDSDGG
jgi:hypothetical protein